VDKLQIDHCGINKMELANGNRYEIKMVYDALRIYEVRQWVRNHYAGFHTAYPTRLVNNVYFDTEELGAFNDHISGCGSRQKLRFRWYHNHQNVVDGQLELKRKDVNIGSKYSQDVNGIDLKNDSWTTIKQKMVSQSTDEMQLLIRSAEPVLINTYQRDYFVSGDGITRLTLDYNLKAWDQRVYAKPNMRVRIPLLNVMVIEFKRDIAGHKEFANILAKFPLRVTNYSKYVQSLNSILGW
jgi:hypothetical protein